MTWRDYAEALLARDFLTALAGSVVIVWLIIAARRAIDREIREIRERHHG